ncbi:MAG: hypothetical protein ACRD04_10345 [Terriglobales bacterium]
MKLWPVFATVLLLALLAPAAPAPATFYFSGRGFPSAPYSGANIAGTLTIDVAHGKVTAVDIALPGLEAFKRLVSSARYKGSDWRISAADGIEGTLSLTFDTGKTPASLVGFAGGRLITGWVLLRGTGIFQITSGAITRH